LTDPEIDKKLKEAKELKEEAAVKKGTVTVEKGKNDFKDEGDEAEESEKKNIDSLVNKGELLAKNKKVDKDE
jgi:hypothetical protein